MVVQGTGFKCMWMCVLNSTVISISISTLYFSCTASIDGLLNLLSAFHSVQSLFTICHFPVGFFRGKWILRLIRHVTDKCGRVLTALRRRISPSSWAISSRRLDCSPAIRRSSSSRRCRRPRSSAIRTGLRVCSAAALPPPLLSATCACFSCSTRNRRISDIMSLTKHTHWAQVLSHTRHKIGNFGDVAQANLKKLNLTQQKHTTQKIV